MAPDTYNNPSTAVCQGSLVQPFKVHETESWVNKQTSTANNLWSLLLTKILLDGQ